MSSRHSKMAAQLRTWAAEIEAADAIDLDHFITIAEAVRVLRAATGGEYLSVRLDLTVNSDGSAKADWSTYVHNYSHDGGHATLRAAVEARLNLLREASRDAIETVEATLNQGMPIEATAGSN